jgi:hypothetical protein
MPGVDGIELATEARRLRRDLYIVFASGRDRVDGAPFCASRSIAKLYRA